MQWPGYVVRKNDDGNKKDMEKLYAEAEYDLEKEKNIVEIFR